MIDAEGPGPRFDLDPDPTAEDRHRDLVRPLLGPASSDRTLAPWADLGRRDQQLWDFNPRD
ncbi:hypothetical protein [Tautonia sociabilis]|uniref:Uncharacterized protein n=1 Tax=Tautonia sociabilis TaxID=2080755 RepID=A0A432MDL3_9BACT|nr:hypothetical protein [Tautonia sociabilis]RUL82927.1 hypothetical protein TsocGM_23005 [Tautonia sociabilis]